MSESLQVNVTREEYKQLQQLNQPCDVKDLKEILQDERAEAIFSASFHDQEVFVVVSECEDDEDGLDPSELQTDRYAQAIDRGEFLPFEGTVDPHSWLLVDELREEDYEVCPTCLDAEDEITENCPTCNGSGYVNA